MSNLKVKQLTDLDNTVTVNVVDILTKDSTLNSDIISYKSSAEGGVKRSLTLKGMDVYSVKDFGAKGDFATDDTAAIQAALSAAGSATVRGAVVYLPAGIYNVSGTITIPTYVTVQGAGRWSTIIRCTASGSTVSPILAMTNGFSSLKGVGVVYSSLQASTGTCIRSTGSSNTLYDFSASAGFVGVDWYTGSATKMDNFDILDCKSVGLKIGENNTGFSNDLVITKFFIITTDTTNFALGALRVLGRVEALFASKFDLIGSTYPITTDAGTTNGLRFSNFTDGFFDSGAQSAMFDAVNNTTFANCWFSNRNAGAQFTNCFNLTFTGVRVWNNTAQGLIFTNTCRQIDVSGTFGNNNIGATTGVQDIYIDGSCSLINIHNVTGEGAGSTNYLVNVGSGASYITLRDIKVTARSSGYISLGGSNTGLVIDGVSGFVTKSSGSSSIPASATSVSVAHGLSMTPNLANISITPNGATASNLYISAVTSTTFTVSTISANTGAAPFSWQADVSYK